MQKIVEGFEKLKKYWKIIVIVAIALGIAIAFLIRPNSAPQAEQNIDKLIQTTNSSANNKKPSTSESSSRVNKVTVDIKGEVKQPGVFTLNADSRVNDVIKMAGGFTTNADQKSVNLAEKLKDEQVIYVANKAEAVPSTTSSSSSSSTSVTPGNSGSNSSKKVNINTADLAGLETLSGIGEKKAQDIIDYRTQNGPFKSIEDLGKVSGFGDKTVERLKDSITVN